jgi:hypothetical protein
VETRDMTVRFAGFEGVDRHLTVVRGGFMVDAKAPRPLHPTPKLGEHSSKILSTAVIYGELGFPPRLRADCSSFHAQSAFWLTPGSSRSIPTAIRPASSRVAVALPRAS